MAAGTPQYTAQNNALARQIVLNNSINAVQQIFTQTITSNIPGYVFNIPVRPVGLIKRFWVEIAATVTGTAGVTHTLTPFGAANFISQVILTDLSQQVRVQTTGWHLQALASAKYKQPYGCAITAVDDAFGYGNNFLKTQTAPLTITGVNSSNNVYIIYEIPVSYSDYDLRGAIYANVVSATMNLQITINSGLFAISTLTDAILAMYQSNGTTASTCSSLTLTVYQNYLDQLPVQNGQAVLPYFDIGTAYLLNATTLTGLVTAQDFPIPYANFRQFLSTFLVYDNGGTLNGGTDVTYFAIQSANFTNVIKHDPFLSSLWSRNRLSVDFPLGMYYWDHRDRPISTIQFGNMALIINPSGTVNANANIYMGYESLAIINQITAAGSLPGS